jgi:serine phosphatase RsbU (regulator of sigma subunit)
MAYLQLLKGSQPRRIEFEGDTLVLGRSPECGVVLDTGAVSRQHAQIVHKGERYFIEDLNSRNGTYVNGNRIDEPTELADNARVKICDYLFTFHSEPAKRATPTLEVEITDKGDSGTIMSTLDASTSTGLSGLVAEVRPEVKLRAVLEITRNLGTVLRLEELLPKILDSLFKIFPQADRGYILLRDDAANRLIPKAIKNRREGGDDSLRISRTIVKKVLDNNQAILLADASSDQQFNMAQSIADFQICSIMCVPLVGQDNRALGIIQVHAEDRRHQFTKEDLDVLVSVASTATIALENARLHEDLLERERVQRELQFAREVQRGFLPSDWPEVPGYGFYAFYEAAHTVGGDYYGFIELPDGRVAISLGDVSGKGMPAALLMAHLASDVRFSATTAGDPAAAVRSVNRSLSEAGLADKFVTLLLMVLDPTKHTLSIVNAGHMPPMIRNRSGEVVEVGENKAGLPLNVSPDPDYKYETISVALEPGATVMVYTDGVSEAMSPTGELFDQNGRLLDTFKNAPADPVQAGEAVIQQVRRHAAGVHQSDDITLICFGRNPA